MEKRRKEKFRLTVYHKSAKQRRRISYLCVCWSGRGQKGGQTGENGPEEEILKQKAGSEIVRVRMVAAAASYKMDMTPASAKKKKKGA